MSDAAPRPADMDHTSSSEDATALPQTPTQHHRFAPPTASHSFTPSRPTTSVSHSSAGQTSSIDEKYFLGQTDRKEDPGEEEEEEERREQADDAVNRDPNHHPEDFRMNSLYPEFKGRQRLHSFSTVDDMDDLTAQRSRNSAARRTSTMNLEWRNSRRLSTQVSQQMSKHLSVFTALPPVPLGYDEEVKNFAAYPARHSVFRQSALYQSHSAPPAPTEKAGETTATSTELEEEQTEYPGMRQRLLIVMAILMAAFLTALDRTIIATAIPKITDEFDSIDDIGWYGSAFLLTASCFQLVLGRLYSFNSPKYVFLACMLIFEIGSALCGAAPNSITLILGRAVAGLGTAGIMSGAIIMMISTIPLQQRPIYQGLFGGVFGASSVVGPLIGGAFTTNLSWRWCFYINLPIGGASILLLLFVLPATVPTEPGKSFVQQLKSIDLVGEAFLLPSIIALLLVLQWGGSTYAWRDWRCILLFIVFGLALAAFVAVQYFWQETATIKATTIKNRSICAAAFYVFTLGGALIMAVYFLPLWFQTIKNVSALQSGIDGLPVIMASVAGSVFAGVLVSRFGYYVPFMILGSVMGAVGLGLLSTFNLNTTTGTWIGYQIVLGFGLGAGVQQGSLVAQTVLSKADANMGVSLLFLTQQIGSAIFLSLGENIFSEVLLKNLEKQLPGLDPTAVTGVGATSLRAKVPPELLTKILTAYNGAIQQLFLAGACLACVSLIGSCSVQWVSVRNKKLDGGSLEAAMETTVVPPLNVVAPNTPKPRRRFGIFSRGARRSPTNSSHQSLDIDLTTRPSSSTVQRHHTVKIPPPTAAARPVTTRLSSFSNWRHHPDPDRRNNNNHNSSRPSAARPLPALQPVTTAPPHLASLSTRSPLSPSSRDAADKAFEAGYKSFEAGGGGGYKAFEAGGGYMTPERISQAPTAVSESGFVDPPKYAVGNKPPPSKVRHVSQLAKHSGDYSKI